MICSKPNFFAIKTAYFVSGAGVFWNATVIAFNDLYFDAIEAMMLVSKPADNKIPSLRLFLTAFSSKFCNLKQRFLRFIGMICPF